MKEQFEVVRAISSYNKATEYFINEVAISLTLAQLKTIFTPHPDDPLMYNPYSIGHEQAIQLHHLDNTIQLDIEQFDYQLECYQAGT